MNKYSYKTKLCRLKYKMLTNIDKPIQNTFVMTDTSGATISAITFISYSCPGSNWWSKQPFIWRGYKMFSSEQAFMLEKAILFDDDEIIQQILKINHPTKSLSPYKCNNYAKKLGRRVKNFNQKIWNDNAQKLITEVLFEKFKQCSVAYEWLKSTCDNYLIESSSKDTVWGIGMNWLGNCLMEVRKRIFD